MTVEQHIEARIAALDNSKALRAIGSTERFVFNEDRDAYADALRKMLAVYQAAVAWHLSTGAGGAELADLVDVVEAALAIKEKARG